MQTNVQKLLDRFGGEVVKGAQTELKKQKKDASGALSKSLSYESKANKNSFSLDIYMEEYGIYVDQGVKGVGGTKADGTRWRKKLVFGSKFKYKKLKPPIMAFNGWTIRKGIAPRSSGGQFQKRRGLLYAIAKSVYHTGIETTHFFTKPFEDNYKDLPDDLIEAYALDVEDLLEFSLKR